MFHHRVPPPLTLRYAVLCCAVLGLSWARLRRYPKRSVCARGASCHSRTVPPLALPVLSSKALICWTSKRIRLPLAPFPLPHPPAVIFCITTNGACALGPLSCRSLLPSSSPFFPLDNLRLSISRASISVAPSSQKPPPFDHFISRCATATNLRVHDKSYSLTTSSLRRL